VVWMIQRAETSCVAYSAPNLGCEEPERLCAKQRYLIDVVHIGVPYRRVSCGSYTPP
jgi:hypothetical protein